MPLAVFLRAVNVGGHKAFKPSRLVKELAHLRLVNIGAAGTFVVRATVSQKALRAELSERIPFDAELMICSGRDLVTLLSDDPFPQDSLRGDTRRFVSVLAKRPRALPALPLCQPKGEQWRVKVSGISARFALCLWRSLGRPFLDPTRIVEKAFGVSATTRNWNTMVKIGEILEGGEGR